jgi:hypothetical protein
MNGQMFLAYVEQCLVPELRRGDIVVRANLQAHKVAGYRKRSESAEAEIFARPQPDRTALAIQP